MENFFIGLGIIMVCVAIIFSAVMVKRQRCIDGYENYQPDWGFFSGCRIVYDGKLTPVDIVREIQ